MTSCDGSLSECREIISFLKRIEQVAVQTGNPVAIEVTGSFFPCFCKVSPGLSYAVSNILNLALVY
jgi:hypothetical protein